MPQLGACTEYLIIIFYNLCVGRVYFRSATSTLYYVDSPSVCVTDTIVAVFGGFRQQAHIKQLYLDRHQLIKAAFCLNLTQRQHKPVLVALRRRGVHVDIT